MSHGLKQTSKTGTFDLTRRELISLTLAANGLGDTEIASRLSVDVTEVEQALRDAKGKLGANNRLHAVAIAIRQGLIGIEVKG